MHTFRKGHRVVVQIQSNWFPIADRNPNKFMNIHKATDADFQKANISLLWGGSKSSKIVFRQLTK
jgi:predicted acyl esterase